jgi:hypothetical protein
LFIAAKARLASHQQEQEVNYFDINLIGWMEMLPICCCLCWWITPSWKFIAYGTSSFEVVDSFDVASKKLLLFKNWWQLQLKILYESMNKCQGCSLCDWI